MNILEIWTTLRYPELRNFQIPRCGTWASISRTDGDDACAQWNVYTEIMFAAYMSESLLVSSGINAIYITTGLVVHEVYDLRIYTEPKNKYVKYHMPEILLMLNFSKFSDVLFAEDGLLFHNRIIFITVNSLQ